MTTVITSDVRYDVCQPTQLANPKNQRAGVKLGHSLEQAAARYANTVIYEPCAPPPQQGSGSPFESSSSPAADYSECSESTAETATPLVGRVLGERIVCHTITVPKKVIREDIVEKIVVVPETIVREEIVDEIRVVRETIIEISKPVYKEKIVEVPEIEYREKPVEVVHKIFQEKVVEMPIPVLPPASSFMSCLPERSQPSFGNKNFSFRPPQSPTCVTAGSTKRGDRIPPRASIRESIATTPTLLTTSSYPARIMERQQTDSPAAMSLKDSTLVALCDSNAAPASDFSKSPNLRWRIPVPLAQTVTHAYVCPRVVPRFVKVPYALYLPTFVEVPVSAFDIDQQQLEQLESIHVRLRQLVEGQNVNLHEIEDLIWDIRRHNSEHPLPDPASELSSDRVILELTTEKRQQRFREMWTSGQIIAVASSASSFSN